MTLFNPVKILKKKLLSENWGVLEKVKYEYTLPNGNIQVQEREVYNRGNGAVILLYNKQKQTVILTRQFRLPTWFNGNADGLMIEACAGVIDENDPEECIRRETEEETGYTISEVQRIMEVYMSPGSVTETITFFVAAYSDRMKTGEGGGLDKEQENIEVLELNFADALQMIKSGEIKDAKTIMLLQYAQINNLLG
jgi:GDP-mannose pyrophosphatase NudK